jgi:hypothetical protein
VKILPRLPQCQLWWDLWWMEESLMPITIIWAIFP